MRQEFVGFRISKCQKRNSYLNGGRGRISSSRCLTTFITAACQWTFDAFSELNNRIATGHTMTGNRKFSVIAAACENLGIGINGNLPWRLRLGTNIVPLLNSLEPKNKNKNKQILYPAAFIYSYIFRSELGYFNRMTTKVIDATKRNCVIMGRKTYLGIPETKRPLQKRLNIVLSNTTSPSDYPSDVVLCNSLPDALAKLNATNLGDDIENVWIVGGHNVYKEAMQSADCERIYLTEIMAKYECDAFFPSIDSTFQLATNPDYIPSAIQEENGIKYQYKVYEKQQ